MMVEYMRANTLSTTWYNKRGEKHRLVRCAVIYQCGSKEWYIYGKRHRTNGPAVEWADGDKEWWVKGKRHRTDGPAIDYGNNDVQFWIDGEHYSFDEFALKTTCTIEQLAIIKLQYA
jgi:hypothetical protein